MKNDNLIKFQSLNEESANQLKKAYMDLFNGLVQMYCENGIPKGAAWYKAMGRIYEILKKREKQIPKQMFDKLALFFNSHREALLKKSMLSAEKDDTQTKKPNGSSIKEEDLIKKFDDTIKKILGNRYDSTLKNMGTMFQPQNGMAA
ncbi:MAG: hypothetical protein K5912_04540 [Alphaproteobacteria bacterium]|nr:hypothetical protein [Alphaproteobacteria bacterium]